MKVDTASKLMDGYVEWLRNSIEFVQEGEAVRIICPMLNRNNDHMSVYLADDRETGGYILTDVGETLGDLAASGCDVLGTDSRRKKLDQTLQGFGVQLIENEIYVKAGPATFFSKLNMLMQSMASVDDLFYTVRPSNRSFFFDIVAQWLDDNSIRHVDNIRISGRSGFEAKFDFVIPRNGSAAPERLIKTINAPSETTVKNALFGWSDIREARGGSVSYIFLNGTDGKFGGVDNAITQACRTYDVEPVVWRGDVDKAITAKLAA